MRVSEQGALVIGKLAAEDIPAEVERVRLGLVELLPRLPITELLIEVDRWTRFSDQLTHAGGQARRDDTLLRQLYAAVLAQACNFGITAMAEATGLTYDTLAWTTQWYLRETNAALVNYHHRLPMAGVWGAGTLSSSDGQRFPMKGKSLTARALSRYFINEGISTYTHVRPALHPRHKDHPGERPGKRCTCSTRSSATPPTCYTRSPSTPPTPPARP